MHIALLEDDAQQAKMMVLWLSSAGHTCRAFGTGQAFIDALQRERFDLLIIDWMLPDISGDQVLAWVRGNLGWGVPVLFVTARDEEGDIVRALKLGADDYMVKPVRMAEFSARVGALLRRAYPDNANSVMVFGRYRFIAETRGLEMDGKPVELKAREYELALFLFQNLGRLLSRDHLREIIWGHSAEVISRSLDTHISRLRSLLDLRPSNGYMITAVYGVGYRFETVKPVPGEAAPEGGGAPSR